MPQPSWIILDQARGQVLRHVQGDGMEICSSEAVRKVGRWARGPGEGAQELQVGGSKLGQQVQSTEEEEEVGPRSRRFTWWSSIC